MKKYTESQRRQRLELVRSFPKSGLSRTEFCRRHNLPVSTFDYWRRTAQIEEASSTFEGQFVEVRVEDTEDLRSTQDMEIELPYGVKIRFFGIGQSR